MANDTEEDRIRQVLMDYRSGQLNKYEAMDALELDNIHELFNFLAKYGIPPELTPFHYQSNPSAKPLKDFLKEEG